jgi:Protein of unknown function (DUF3489)
MCARLPRRPFQSTADSGGIASAPHGSRQRSQTATSVQCRRACRAIDRGAVTLLKRKNGVTIDEIVAETDWQAHSV